MTVIFQIDKLSSINVGNRLIVPNIKKPQTPINFRRECGLAFD